MLIYETKLTNEIITFDIDRTNQELINMQTAPSGGGDFANILSPLVTKN